MPHKLCIADITIYLQPLAHHLQLPPWGPPHQLPLPPTEKVRGLIIIALSGQCSCTGQMLHHMQVNKVPMKNKAQLDVII